MNLNIIYALGAAVLFGASTPLAKLLLGEIPPLQLAGLLYLGSGIGLSLIRYLRDRSWQSSGIAKLEWSWLTLAILVGGVLAPVLLMFGLQQIGGANAALLLNMEAVFTALIAWLVFRETFNRRVALGMLAIVGGGATLSWPWTETLSLNNAGSLLVISACFCWGMDNNLTRHVSSADALFIAALKGLVAGGINCLLAMALGAHWPTWPLLALSGLVGLFGYGVSLALFILALRGLGSARTSAYFSTSPFIGALFALVLLHDPSPPAFWLTAVLMAYGVYLHLTEHHEHPHLHEALAHTHRHAHDQHHQHTHDFPWDNRKAHSHFHLHTPMLHEHPHFPDIHHRHTD